MWKGVLTSFNNIYTSWIPSFPLPQEQQNCIVRQRSKIFSIFDLRAITFQNNAHWLRGGNAKFVFTYVNNGKKIFHFRLSSFVYRALEHRAANEGKIANTYLSLLILQNFQRPIPYEYSANCPRFSAVSFHETPTSNRNRR